MSSDLSKQLDMEVEKAIQNPSRKSKLKLETVPLVVCRSPFEVTNKNYFSRIYYYCFSFVQRYLN